MNKNKLLVAITVLLLTACGSDGTKDDFDCPVNQGEGCQTIGEADGNLLGKKGVAGDADAGVQASTVDAIKAESQQPAPNTIATESLRVPERVGRIFVFGFIDSNGTLHEGGYVHVVISEAGWR